MATLNIDIAYFNFSKWSFVDAGPAISNASFFFSVTFRNGNIKRLVSRRCGMYSRNSLIHNRLLVGGTVLLMGPL